MTTGEVIALIKAFGGGGGGSSGGGVLAVHATSLDNKATLDKTWQQIYNAVLSGGAVVVTQGETFAQVDAVTSVMDDEGYYVLGGETEYFTDNADGYPTSVGK